MPARKLLGRSLRLGQPHHDGERRANPLGRAKQYLYGITTVSAGTLVEQSGNSNWTMSSATTTVANGADLRLDVSSETGAETDNFKVNVASGGTCELFTTNATVDSAWTNTGSTFSGGGILAKTGRAFRLCRRLPELQQLQRRVVVSAGDLGINYNNNGTIIASSASLTVNSDLDFRNGAFMVDAFSGSGTITLASGKRGFT